MTEPERHILNLAFISLNIQTQLHSGLHDGSIPDALSVRGLGLNGYDLKFIEEALESITPEAIEEFIRVNTFREVDDKRVRGLFDRVLKKIR